MFDEPAKATATSDVPLTPPSHKMAERTPEEKKQAGGLCPPLEISKDEWVADNLRQHCRCCRTKFTPTNRRHHCRVSGEVICGGCSLHEPVQGNFVRVSLRQFCKNLRHFPESPEPIPRMLFGKAFGNKVVSWETKTIRTILQDDVSKFIQMMGNNEVDKVLYKTDGRRALHFAAQEGCAAIVAHLIQANATISCKCMDGRTPLHLAARQDDVDIVTTLLDAGAAINEQDDEEITPLHVAAEASSAVLQELMGHVGRELTAQSIAGAQPLHYAAAHLDDDVKSVRLLLDAGVDIAIEDEMGYTPMHYAAAAGNSAIIRFLYEKGAGVESIDSTGCTPLLTCAKNNHYDATTTLLKLGSTTTKKDFETKSFVDHAVNAGGVALMAAIEFYQVSKPTDSMVHILPADGFLKYAMPGSLSALAGVPRVPSSDRVFVQTASIVNDSSDSIIMFRCFYEDNATRTPGKPNTSCPGSYTLYPKHGFVAPNSSAAVNVELRMPTSRLFKEFENDHIRFQAVQISKEHVFDSGSNKVWSRIENNKKRFWSLGIKVRCFDASQARGLSMSSSGGIIASV
eukprot:m.1362517 g.1362517  ORF g.1362517 m.1362517 type:complete len:570 (+) comp24942_c1_seq69:137-1846(+)